MPLETSGTLSIGGTTTNRSINLELGRSATATSSLGETDLRDLAGVASGTISISNFYGASSGYNVENSIKVQANSSNEWFYRSSPTAGNKRTFTFSFWFKRTQLTGFEADPYLMSQGTNARFHFAGDTLRFMFDGNSTEMEAAGKLRDTSAWYHIVLAVDTTQATNTNRVKMYVNGEDYPFNNNDWPSQNQESSWMSGTNMYFNTRDGDGSYDNSGYWAEVAVIDGSALTPTSFGEYDNSGIWKPKDLSGLSFGNQGFYLKFDNAASLGADSSGNGKNVTLNNIAAADQALDTPTNNFAILSSAMQTDAQSSSSTISEGGTKFRCTTADTWVTVVSSIGVTSGKWYAEFKVRGARPNNNFGIASMEQLDTGNSRLGESGGNWGIGFYQPNGNLSKVQNSGYSLISGWGSSISQLQIVGIAVDMDNHNLYIAINNTYQNSGNPTSGATGTGAISFDDTETVAIAMTGYSLGGGNDTIVEGNFGGYTAYSNSTNNTDANGYGAFTYAPPSGYYALCTKNLAEYG